MKNIWLSTVAIVVFFLAASLASAATITREMPDSATVGSVFSVTITLAGLALDEPTVFEDLLPEGFTIQTFEISGTHETSDDISLGVADRTYSWVFTPSSDTVIITYWVTASTVPEDYTFEGFVTTPADQNQDARPIRITLAICGDSICDESEDYQNCFTDCSFGEQPIAAEPEQPAPSGDGTSDSGPSDGMASDGSQDTVGSAEAVQESAYVESSTSTEDIFARKQTDKSKQNIIMITGSALAVLALLTFGVYTQIQKKQEKSGLVVSKERSKDIQQEVKETLARLKARTTAHEITNQEHVENVSSELPSFSERMSRLELPSMPSEFRTNNDASLSIPPMAERRIMPPSMQSSQGKKSLFNFKNALAKKPTASAAPPPPKKKTSQEMMDVTEEEMDSELDSVMNREFSK